MMSSHRRTNSSDGEQTLGSTSVLLFEEKAAKIEAVLAQPTVDLWQLRELALSEGGLVNDSIRQRAWPALVGLHNLAAQEEETNDNNQEEPLLEQDNQENCVDVAQVELDVARCTWHLLTGTQRVQRLQMEHKRNKRIARVIRKKQGRLARCIERTLQQSRGGLHYYQGFHDVACIFLATLRDAAPPRSWTFPSVSPTAATAKLDLPSAVLWQVSQSHLQDCMQDTFAPLQTTLTLTIFPLLALLDPAVHNHLQACDMAPFFALPWVLTWFSHEIRDTTAVKRLFDAFMASHPSFPIYVCLAMVLHPYNRALILDTDCDFSALHQTLTGLPRNSNSVGWKYQPGTGYVSDHEDDGSTVTNEADETSTLDGEEDDDASIQSNVSSIRTGNTGEMVLLQAGILERNFRSVKAVASGDMLSVTSSMSTTQATEDESAQRVPFQELFDGAVKYMHRVPPRRLLMLARRYHGKEYVEELLASNNDTLPAMLQEPEQWVLNPTSPAEWWLKAKVREARGLPPRTHHHKRPALHKLPNQSATSSGKEFVPVLSSDFVKLIRKRQKDNLNAPVASGMALSVQEEKRLRQRERIGFTVIALLVVLLAWQIMPRESFDVSASTESVVPMPEATETCQSDFATQEEPSCPILADGKELG